MDNKISYLQDQIDSLRKEDIKFDKGNKSAGTRMRKTLQALISASKEMRKQIQTIKNSK